MNLTKRDMVWLLLGLGFGMLLGYLAAFAYVIDCNTTLRTLIEQVNRTCICPAWG